MKVCCFTGHRELPRDRETQRSLEQAIRKAVTDAIADGFTVFYAGGAVGFDMLASIEVLLQKRSHPELKLIEALPFPGHDKTFSAEDKQRFAMVKGLADELVYVSEAYHEGCFRRRNEYMVDRSERLIAYVRRPVGGSASTYAYAQKCGIETVLL